MRQWGGYSLTSGQDVAVVVDNKEQRASVVAEVQAQVQNGKVSVFELGAELLGAKVDGVIAYGASHIDNTLQQALSALKPGGFVALYVPVNGGVKDEEVDEKLMLSGFINSKTSKSADFAEFSATKPDWEVGASQKLNLKKPANSLSAQDAKNIWSSKATGAEEELIDEDELLDEDEKNAKPNTNRDDCEIKPGKKACKNCTCGRADGIDSKPAKLTKEMIENPGVNSSCSGCSLGDAFRCAGCPYRGLPAFKVGEKITIPDGFMDDDI
jgi:hypothetical protein